MKSKIRSNLDIDPQDIGLLSLRRTWQSVGPEKSSAWTTIYSYITGEGLCGHLTVYRLSKCLQQTIVYCFNHLA